MDKKERELLGPLGWILKVIPKDLQPKTPEQKLLVQIRRQVEACIYSLHELYIKNCSLMKENYDFCMTNEDYRRVLNEIKRNKPEMKITVQKVLAYDNLMEKYKKQSNDYLLAREKLGRIKQKIPEVGEKVYISSVYAKKDNEIGLDTTVYECLTGEVLEYTPAMVRIRLTKESDKNQGVIYIPLQDCYRDVEALKRSLKRQRKKN